jgi:hypothetical protein
LPSQGIVAIVDGLSVFRLTGKDIIDVVF